MLAALAAALQIVVPVDRKPIPGGPVPPIPPAFSTNSLGVLAIAYPPCGTPEAAKTEACVQWKVVKCPTTWKPDAVKPLGCAQLLPIEAQVWVPSESKKDR